MKEHEIIGKMNNMISSMMQKLDSESEAEYIIASKLVYGEMPSEKLVRYCGRVFSGNYNHSKQFISKHFEKELAQTIENNEHFLKNIKPDAEVDVALLREFKIKVDTVGEISDILGFLSGVLGKFTSIQYDSQKLAMYYNKANTLEKKFSLQAEEVKENVIEDLVSKNNDKEIDHQKLLGNSSYDEDNV